MEIAIQVANPIWLKPKKHVWNPKWLFLCCRLKQGSSPSQPSTSPLSPPFCSSRLPSFLVTLIPFSKRLKHSQDYFWRTICSKSPWRCMQSPSAPPTSSLTTTHHLSPSLTSLPSQIVRWHLSTDWAAHQHIQWFQKVHFLDPLQRYEYPQPINIFPSELNTKWWRTQEKKKVLATFQWKGSKKV